MLPLMTALSPILMVLRFACPKHLMGFLLTVIAEVMDSICMHGICINCFADPVPRESTMDCNYTVHIPCLLPGLCNAFSRIIGH